MEKKRGLFLLILIIAYLWLHINYPNLETLTNSPESFKDEKGQEYFLSYDAYSFLQGNDGLSNLVSLDRKFTEFIHYKYTYLFSPYISAFFGLLCLIILYFILSSYIEDELAATGILLFILDGYFFAPSIFYYLDNNTINLFFLLSEFWVFKKLLEDFSKTNILKFGIILFLLALIWSHFWFGSFIGIILIFLSFSIEYLSFKYKEKEWLLFILALIMIISFLLGIFSVHSIHERINEYFLLKSSISELKSFTFNFYYLAIIIMAIMGMYISKDKILMIWFIPLLMIGILRHRFFLYVLPFLVIGVCLSFKKFISLLPKTKENILKEFIIYVIVVFIIVYHGNFTNYNGGYYGYPFVEDALVNASEWIKDNTPEDSVIISYWDNGIFYEYYGKRTALFKSVDFGFDEYATFLLQDEENAIIYNQRFGKNKTFIIETKKFNCFIDPNCNINIERVSGLRYTNKTLLWKILNNQTLNNFTVFYKAYGVRENYIIFGGK